MFLKLSAFSISFQRFMADASLNLKRKKRGSNSSTSDNELKSPEEKRARDKPLIACEQAPSEPARCEKNSASEERDSASEASGTRGSL